MGRFLDRYLYLVTLAGLVGLFVLRPGVLVDMVNLATGIITGTYTSVTGKQQRAV